MKKKKNIRNKAIAAASIILIAGSTTAIATTQNLNNQINSSKVFNTTEEGRYIGEKVFTDPNFTPGASTNVTSNSITLNWTLDLTANDQEDAPVLSSMTIKNTENLIQDIVIAEFDTITYTIDNLSSGTDYNFTLEYKWDTDNSTSSGNFGTVTTTAITEPKFKEENPTNITATSLDLNWGFDLNAANENEIAPTLATMLIKSESLEKDIVVENLAARTFKITGLEPETSHTFSLHYTWNEDKAASGSFTPVSTKPATITPPEFIKEDASNVTATSLDLNWGFNLNAANADEIAPVLSSMTIKNTENLIQDIVINKFDTITYTIDNLSSGTDYNFTLEYKWDTDNSTSSGNFGTVTTTAITEPKFKEENPTNITATSLDLNWGFDLNAANENEIAPTLATMLIKSESLEKDIVVENLAARTFKITGLEPETSHTFSLHYTWNEDKAASGSFTPVSTKPATITPPEFIKEDASNVTATSLDLNWGFNLNAAN
ncbi:MAG: hypothetical protein HRS50_02225, partial [Mycoplasmataceae bacterium]|nr:hypothetical protein [Mycoplasmataceae bacterium]